MRLFIFALALFTPIIAGAIENPNRVAISNNYDSVVNVNYAPPCAANQPGYPCGDLLLPSNPARAYLHIQNKSGNTLIVKFQSAITLNNEGVQLAGGSTFHPVYVPGASVFGKAIGGNVTATIIEGQN